VPRLHSRLSLPPTRRFTHLGLDMCEIGIAQILAVHHVDHVLADILRMIADALERARDPHRIHDPRDRARVLDHERDAPTRDRLVLLVDDIVGLHDRERRVRIATRERVERAAQHLLNVPREVAELAIVRRRTLDRREPRGQHADLLRLVADTLEIGDGLDHGDDQAQVARRRRARREDPAALLVDADLHAVDLVVVLGDLETELAIAFGERAHPASELLLDESAHRQHGVADALEILVEATRNVVPEIFAFHRRLLLPRDADLEIRELYDRPSGCAFRAAAPRDPLRRETARERAAFTLATLDRERRAVPLQRVLDDREAEPRAARRARTAGIDSIEALGDPRDLILGDADAGILHRELRPLAARTPRDVDPSGRRRETHRVVDQIVEDRVELRFAAKQREVGLEMKLKSASL